MRTLIALALLVAVCLTADIAAQDAPTRTLFTNVMVWDGTSDSRTSADVLVEGNMIVGVGSGLSSSGATVATEASTAATTCASRCVRPRAR